MMVTAGQDLFWRNCFEGHWLLPRSFYRGVAGGLGAGCRHGVVPVPIDDGAPGLASGVGPVAVGVRRCPRRAGGASLGCACSPARPEVRWWGW